MKELDKNVETAEQRNISQTKNVIESPQQEPDQGKLQKESFKQSQHTSQEFQPQESAVQVVDRKYETAEQKQFLQTTSTIDSPQQDTVQEKLQKQSSKLSQHTSQEFQPQESAVQVVDRNYETAEQKQFSQTTSTIESPQQETDQGKLQKQSSKLLEHSNQKFKQPESTVKVLNKKQETAEQKYVSQTIDATESPSEKRQGKLQKQSSNQSQHINQKIRKQDLIKDVKQPEILKTSQQNQIGQTGKSLLKESEKDSSKLSTDNSKIQKGMRFVGKLSKNSLIATKDSIKGGIKKYQKALEQEDEGVRIGSQGITQGYRVTRTLTKKGFGLAEKSVRKLEKLKGSKKTKGPNKKTSVKKLRKSRQEKLYIKKLDKGKIERFQKLKKPNKKASVKKLTKAKAKKLTKATAKKITKVTTNIAGSSALKYQEQLEKGDEGVKLASQSATKIARATNKLIKNRIKANAKLGKMGKQKGKLVPFSKDKKLKVESRTLLKKKAVKKKMYYGSFRDKNKAKTLTSIASNVKNQVANLLKSLGKFNLQNVKKLIGT